MSSLRPILAYILLLVAAVALCPLAHAQVYEPGVIPTYNAGRYKWQSLRTEHFEVLYYGQHQTLAANTLRFAEAAYEDLAPMLEHTPRYPMQLHVYPSPFVFQTQAERRTFYDKRNLHINVGSVYFPGTQTAYNRVVRTEVAELMLEDMFFGAGFQGGVQNRLLLNVPPWYNDGLCLLLGEGWQPYDEALMRSLVNTDYLTPILNEDQLFATATVQKSLWRYVTETYGYKRLSEIVYMTRLTRSAENAFISVLGLTLPALTQKWQAYVRDNYTPNPATSFAADSAAKPLMPSYDVPDVNGPKLKKQDVLCGAALAQDGNLLALTVRRGTHYRVLLYNPKTKATTYTGISARAPYEQILVRPPHVPMAWSATHKLLVALPKGERVVLHLYDPQKQNSVQVKLKDDIDVIQALSWAPVGERVAMTATVDGQTDLYIYQADKKTLLRLTNDIYDDIDPAWSPNGATLYFASNRDSLLAPAAKANYRMAGNSYDLYALNIAAPTAPLRRLTATPLEDETRPVVVDSSHLVYISTVSGSANLRVLNPALPDGGRFLTDYPTGIWQPTASASGKLWLLPSFADGLPTLYLRSNPDRNQSLNPKLAPLAPQMAFSYKQHYLAGQPQQASVVQVGPGKDTAMKVFGGPNKPNIPDTSKFNNGPGGNPTNPADTSKKGVKFYVFDEDETPKPPKKKNLPALQNPTPPPAPKAPFDINTLKVFAGDKPKFTLNLRQTELGIRIDPLYRLGIFGRVYMEDPFRYHQFYGHLGFFIDMKSSDVKIGYLNRRFPVHYGLEVSRAGRYLDVGQPFTYTTFSVDGTVRYPITRYASVSLLPSYTDITRRDLRLNDFTNLDGRTQLAGLRFKLLYDNTKSKPNFILSGLRAEFNIGSNYSIQNKDLRYGSMNLDVRYYQPVLGKLVLALRFAAATALDNHTPTYFLGGMDNWLNAEFLNRTDLPIAQDVEALNFSQVALPLRGFSYNARNGSRYGVINAELRVPIFKLFNSSLTSSALHNLQWAIYYDIGTAWRTGNPFSQQNPIDVTTINQPPLTIVVQSLKSPFIQGFGTGVRALLLGYFVRLDVAWGIEDSTLGKTQFSVSLGTEF